MPKRPVSAKVSGTSVCHAFTFALKGRVFWMSCCLRLISPRPAYLPDVLEFRV